jgi:hypothetical protein
VLLRFDPIRPGAFGGLERFDCEAHLLAERAGEEAAHRMRHPAGGGHDLLQRGTLGAALGRAASLAALVFLGATGATWGAAVGVKAWTAFQIRAMAVLRSVNFFTGFRSPKGGTPAKPFQISTSRSVGQLAASFESSFSVLNRRCPSGIASPAR